MKKMVFIIVMLLAGTVTAQTRIVYCKPFGQINGPIQAFENFCPLGWTPVTS